MDIKSSTMCMPGQNNDITPTCWGVGLMLSYYCIEPTYFFLSISKLTKVSAYASINCILGDVILSLDCIYVAPNTRIITVYRCYLAKSWWSFNSMTTSVSDRYWLCTCLLSGDLQHHVPLAGQALQLFVMETQVHYGTNRTVKLKRLRQGMLTCLRVWSGYNWTNWYRIWIK